LQPRFEQQLELPQLTVQFSLAELLFAAYVGASWLQSNPCPSRFLDLSVMDDVFNRASGKCASFVSENCCLFIVYKILYFLHATINCFLFHYDCLFHIFSSAASLQPAELIVCVTDVCLSVCVDAVKLFSNRCSLYSFSSSHKTWHSIYVPLCKNLWNRFPKF